MKLADINVRVDIARLGPQVEGVERSTGDEQVYLADIGMALENTATQKLAVRQAGEMHESLWTGKIAPLGANQDWPEVGHVVIVKSVCFANSPARQWLGWRFEVTNAICTTKEVTLSLTAVER